MVPIRGSVTPLAEAEAHRNKILSESTVESTNCRPSVSRLSPRCATASYYETREPQHDPLLNTL